MEPVGEELERLARLKASGDITEAEFEVLKARLIEGVAAEEPDPAVVDQEADRQQTKEPVTEPDEVEAPPEADTEPDEVEAPPEADTEPDEVEAPPEADTEPDEVEAPPEADTEPDEVEAPPELEITIANDVSVEAQSGNENLVLEPDESESVEPGLGDSGSERTKPSRLSNRRIAAFGVVLAAAVVIIFMVSNSGSHRLESAGCSRSNDLWLCSGVDLHGLDLSEANLSEAYLSGANLSGVDLRETDPGSSPRE